MSLRQYGTVPNSRTRPPTWWARNRDNIIIGLAISLIAGIVLLTGKPILLQRLQDLIEPNRANHSTQAPQEKTGIGVLGFAGGCAPFQVYAQNRWAPYGSVIRTAPMVNAKRVASYVGNYSISVNGWLHASVAYVTNEPPFNNDVWFHLTDGSGWVSFAGVRAVPTSQDPTGLNRDGGKPAPLSPKCQGSQQ
jgi:hypothetical protein